MRGLPSLFCVLGATVVALALSFAAFLAPSNVSAGLVFCVALFASAGAFWYVLGRVEQQRRSRVEGLLQLGQRRPALTLYDQKTGLCAGWYFRLRLQEEITRATRYDMPLGLMLVEATGKRHDRKSTARLISSMASTFRTSDLIGHIDEERFGVLLTNTDVESSRTAQQRLLDGLGAGEVTVGLACYPEDATTWRDLLTKAGASPSELYGMSPGDASGAGETSFDNGERVA